jgi:hypothetical protein
LRFKQRKNAKLPGLYISFIAKPRRRMVPSPEGEGQDEGKILLAPQIRADYTSSRHLDRSSQTGPITPKMAVELKRCPEKL